MLRGQKDELIPIKRSLPARPTSYLPPQHRPSPPQIRGLNLSMQGTSGKSQEKFKQGSEGQ